MRKGVCISTGDTVIGMILQIYGILLNLSYLPFSIYITAVGTGERKNDVLFYPALPALLVGCGRDNIKKQVLAEVGFEPTTFGA